MSGEADTTKGHNALQAYTEPSSRNALLNTSPPAVSFRMGLVPIGYITLGELIDRYYALLIAAELPPETAYDYAHFDVAVALLKGQAQAVVAVGNGPPSHRVPTVCWRGAMETGARSAVDWPIMQMSTTNAMIGPRFGVYEGRTALFSESDASQFLEGRKISLQQNPQSTSEMMATVEPAIIAKEGTLNVPLNGKSPTAWLKLPATEQMASTRVSLRGGNPDETALQEEMMLMLKEQGIKNYQMGSIQATRRAIGRTRREGWGR